MFLLEVVGSILKGRHPPADKGESLVLRQVFKGVRDETLASPYGTR